MQVTVKPMGALGARIEGVGLAEASAGQLDAIRQAFFDHHMLAIPGQELAVADALAFSRLFGPLEPHVLSEFHHPETPLIIVLSNVVEDGKPRGLADAGTYWHSDVSYKKRPALATMLYALEVPDDGGDTLFCNMMTAWDEAPADLKRRLDGLQAIHNYAWRSNALAGDLGVRKALTDEQLRETPSVVHPAVRTHPETGRKAIYVNPGFTVGFVGLDQEESEVLKREVFEHCLQDRFVFRYRWQPGDVVIWDNAAVMHSATTRDLPREKRRTLWRTIIVGEEPY